MNGVDVNVKDKNRWTPLMWASFLGYMDVVDLLGIYPVKYTSAI